MFVDESGDPGLPKDGDWSKFRGSKLYARVGLIVHGWKWKSWNARLLDFKTKRGLLIDDEIKACHLRRGSGPCSGWSESQRNLFIAGLATLIGRNTDFTLLGVAIDKTQVDPKASERHNNPSIKSLELLLERYNKFLDVQRDKAGLVVLDSAEEKSDDKLRHFQTFLQSESAFLKPLHIVEGTFFAKSHTSNMLQLADFCSNVFYRQSAYNHKEAEWVSIKPRFWRSGGSLLGFGIKNWP